MEREAEAGELGLALTGLLEPEFDFSQLLEGQDLELGDLYDPKRRGVILSRWTTEPGPPRAEAVVAHELAHALEHQHFGALDPSPVPSSERTAGEEALSEGAATVVELHYEMRHLGARGPLQRLLERRRREIGEGAPRSLQAYVAYPYIEGSRFVEALRRRAGNWRLVDAAYQHPPRSTEHLLQPDKWQQREAVADVHPETGGALGSGWREVGSVELGEFDAAMTLRVGVSGVEARRAASGWAGGRAAVFEWRRRPPFGCGPPCRKYTAALLAWQWDTPRDAREFERAAARYLERGLRGRREGARVWAVEDGKAVVQAGGRRTALTFAPDADRARRLARAWVR